MSKVARKLPKILLFVIFPVNWRKMWVNWRKNSCQDEGDSVKSGVPGKFTDNTKVTSRGWWVQFSNISSNFPTSNILQFQPYTSIFFPQKLIISHSCGKEGENMAKNSNIFYHAVTKIKWEIIVWFISRLEFWRVRLHFFGHWAGGKFQWKTCQKLVK